GTNFISGLVTASAMPFASYANILFHGSPTLLNEFHILILAQLEASLKWRVHTIILSRSEGSLID
ncbi:MAG: hypothetical protein WCR08_02070, partial [Gammaproteobacteria bacterium]